MLRESYHHHCERHVHEHATHFSNASPIQMPTSKKTYAFTPPGQHSTCSASSWWMRWRRNVVLHTTIGLFPVRITCTKLLCYTLSVKLSTQKENNHILIIIHFIGLSFERLLPFPKKHYNASRSLHLKRITTNFHNHHAKPLATNSMNKSPKHIRNKLKKKH